jgi:sulfite reductase (NADPH) hemoprotein beta-component
METSNKQLSEVEVIKTRSKLLRGTLVDSMEDSITGAISADDTQLIKFHGSYQQTDRDLDSERKKQKLEPLYSFMIRVRLPGGITTPDQWLTLDELAGKYGNHTMKLTTRQTIQLHSVQKRNLKKTIREINSAMITTLATCGDINRNVMCSPNPYVSVINKQAIEDANLINQDLLPNTKAYHEIWLADELVGGGGNEEEPIYGSTYLPRKFKIAIAVPPNNDTDVFSNDIGLIAIVEKGNITGYNVIVGGGMGMSFENKQTHPRIGDVLGYISREKLVPLCREIVKIQRDNGNRTDRKLARLKYTIEGMGLENFKIELSKRSGFKLDTAKAFQFVSNSDKLGWYCGKDGLWHLGLFVEGGRIKDTETNTLRTALNEIVKTFRTELIITGNQNLILVNIRKEDKVKIEKILKTHTSLGVHSVIRQNSLACVAFNTCPLAFAEAERYLPSLIDKIDGILLSEGLEKVPITIRMTGCPNGCARPFLAEIGLVGRVIGKYNLYLGADHKGTRLNFLYKEMADEATILQILSGILGQFAKERSANERFGDFVVRKQIVGF